MPLVIQHCESNGKQGRTAHTDGEIKFLIAAELISSCRHCAHHHLRPNATNNIVMEAIYIEVARVGHSLL